MTRENTPSRPRKTSNNAISRQLKKVYSFLRSPLGLALITISSTAIGATITSIAADFSKAQDTRRETIERQQTSARTTNLYVNQILANRALRLRMLEQSFNISNNTNSDIADAWHDYLRTFGNEYVASWDLEAGIKYESYPQDPNWQIFLDTYKIIDNALSKLDTCAYNAYNTYTSTNGEMTQKISRSQQIMNECGYDKKLTWLENCLQTFSYYYHDIRRKSEEAEDGENDGDTQSYYKRGDLYKIIWCAINNDREICRLENEFTRAQKDLTTDCDEKSIL